MKKSTPDSSIVNGKVLVTGDNPGRLVAALQMLKNPDYDPTIEDSYHMTKNYAGKTINLEIFDTGGQEEYQSMLDLQYRGKDLYILTFRIAELTSLNRIQSTVYPAILNKFSDEKNDPNAKPKILLVGLYPEARNDNAFAGTSHLFAAAFAKQIGAVAYLEASPETKEGVQKVFDTAALEVGGFTSERTVKNAIPLAREIFGHKNGPIAKLPRDAQKIIADYVVGSSLNAGQKQELFNSFNRNHPTVVTTPSEDAKIKKAIEANQKTSFVDKLKAAPGKVKEAITNTDAKKDEILKAKLVVKVDEIVKAGSTPLLEQAQSKGAAGNIGK